MGPPNTSEQRAWRSRLLYVSGLGCDDRAWVWEAIELRQLKVWSFVFMTWSRLKGSGDRKPIRSPSAYGRRLLS